MPLSKNSTDTKNNSFNQEKIIKDLEYRKKHSMYSFGLLWEKMQTHDIEMQTFFDISTKFINRICGFKTIFYF